MISTLVKSGLNVSIRPTGQIQAKRFLYPRIKQVVIRKVPEPLGIVEKSTYGVLFVLILYTYPYYVMSHLDDYRRGNKPASVE